jgi:hypothetical protein
MQEHERLPVTVGAESQGEKNNQRVPCTAWVEALHRMRTVNEEKPVADEQQLAVDWQQHVVD